MNFPRKKGTRVNDSAAAVMFFLLFLCACCVAAFWQIRASDWKKVFLATSEAQFRRYAKEYFDRLSDEEIARCVPEEFLHARVVTAFMVMELKRFYGVK